MKMLRLLWNPLQKTLLGLLKASLLLFSILFFLCLIVFMTSCATLVPAPPIGTIYRIDFEHQKAVGVDFPRSATSVNRELSLPELNGYIAFPVETWEQIERYIIELRRDNARCE